MKWKLAIAFGLSVFATLFALIYARSGTAAVAKHFGRPVPSSVRDVHYQSDEWLGLTPEPSYFLRFTASPEDITILLQRNRFSAAEMDTHFMPSVFGSSRRGPAWWQFGQPGTNIQCYARTTKPCVIEWLWWDRSKNRVYYRLSCP